MYTMWKLSSWNSATKWVFFGREVPFPRGDDCSGFQVYYMVFAGKIWESPVILWPRLYPHLHGGGLWRLYSDLDGAVYWKCARGMGRFKTTQSILLAFDQWWLYIRRDQGWWGMMLDDGGWWGMMVVERWKGKNNKNRSQKEKEKDLGGKMGKEAKGCAHF